MKEKNHEKLFSHRRILSLIASALMLVMLFSVSAAAEDFDMATFRENPTVFVIDVDAEEDLAYITTDKPLKTVPSRMKTKAV